MSETNGSARSTASTPAISRRASIREIASVALVLAIPIAAVVATAKPIPGPPSRKVLNFFPQADTTTDESDIQQQPAPEKEKQRTDKKRRAERESSSDQEMNQTQSDSTEQRDSKP